MKTSNIATRSKIGQKIKLAGWVNVRRDHGKIIFIDLRDRSGLVQLVFNPEKSKIYKIADSLRPEYVIAVEGTVKKRPKGMENPKIKTGKIEIEVEKLEILAKSKTPPFELTKDTKLVEEEKRMKYRYLDLRSQRMKKNLILRHKIVKFIRDFLSKIGFLEIETPIFDQIYP